MIALLINITAAQSATQHGAKLDNKDDAPNVRVSWQVTGTRQDAYANRHRIPIEEAKPEAERGTYLHPESFNQPEEKGVLIVQHPHLVERMKQTPGRPPR